MSVMATEQVELPPTDDERARFFSKVEKSNDCWQWTAATWQGYGRFGYHGRTRAAHRLSYIWANGPIPDGLVLDHLEPVTDRDNILRGVGPSAQHAVKTHCPSGHPYDATNTYQYRGVRMCRRCRAAQASSRDASPAAMRVKSDPAHPAHGSLTAYSTYRCRCQKCRDGWAKYSRDRKAATRSASPEGQNS